MNIKSILFFGVAQFFAAASFAQTSTFSAWFVSNYDHKLSERFSFISDIQIRSADKFEYAKTVLVRPAFQYKFSEAQNTAVGYAYFANWNKENGIKTFEQEHRIWEQYQLQLKLAKTKMNHRVRLEQRFLKSQNGFAFAQRMRYYVRSQIPFIKTPEFKKGTFLALQNEIYLNVQNIENVNNHFFDQNRAYAALGYRFNKKFEAEVGYLYQYAIEDRKIHSSIFQLALTTTL